MTNEHDTMGPKEYRKTATIKAVQYLGQHVPGVCTGGVSCQSHFAADDSFPHIHTLEGDLTVSYGDWIATGVKGEHWAIKPDVFAASYELVTQEDAPPDPLLIEARALVARVNREINYHIFAVGAELGERDEHEEMLIALAALRRGMEMGKSA